MATDEYIDALVARKSREILKDIRRLLIEAHEQGMNKDQAVEFVVESAYARLSHDPDMITFIESREGRNNLRSLIKKEVTKIINERKTYYDKEYKKIIKSEIYSPKGKAARLAVLKRRYFGSEDVEAIRSKEIERREKEMRSKEDLKNEKKKLERRDEEDEIYANRGNVQARREKIDNTWQRKAFNWIEDKGGKYFVKGLTLVFFTGIGVALSVALGLSWHFILAFLSLGLYFLFPDPGDVEIPKEVKKLSPDNPLTWKLIFGGGYLKPRSHSVFGGLRSIFKVAVFGLFIWGVYSNPFPLNNVILIILSFLGYSSLKIKYDVNKPYELIESIVRFGFLGLYFIPWVIMYGIFDSMLLAFIAMAFFAIPPVADDKKSSEIGAMYDMYDKILFAVIMVGVLIGFLVGWDISLTDTMGVTFVYFWVVTGISGFFSPAEARPAMGFIMLGGATIIYGIGPGTQEVMSGLFGPWWPTIQNTFSSITEPLGEAFGGLSNTLQGGWLLLTNPVGYATQLMNGTHAANPTGSTGALGVEITDITISPLFPEQPFVITALIENKGALDAEGIVMYLSTGYEAPKSKGPSPMWGPLLVFIPRAYSRDLLTFADMFGMNTYDGAKDMIKCPGKQGEFNPATEICNNKLTRQNILQQTFTSKTGVSCNVMEGYSLREKYIPIRVSVTYNYSSDSEVDIEFINNNEWQRLAESGQLNQELRMIQSQYSTAPVEFPIGTPGMKNPILVDQPFHIGMRIEPSSVRGSIDYIERVVLEYPSDFVLDPQGCTPSPLGSSMGGFSGSSSDTKSIVWTGEQFSGGGTKVFFCPFRPLSESTQLSGPTKTYIVKAHADYTFTKWKEKDTKIEFGGKCCSEDDCLTGQICSQGMCVTEGAAAPQDICPGTCHPPSPEEYTNTITEAAQSNSIDKGLILAIISQEVPNGAHCKGNDVYTGTSGEIGVMQLMPGTASDLGMNPCLYDQNIQGGARYISQMVNRYSQYKDKYWFGIAAYNWGLSYVDAAIDNCGPTWKDITSQNCLEKNYRPGIGVQSYVNNVCGNYGKCNEQPVV